MESIKELKTICQTTAKKDISNVYMRYVCRSISIYITRFLIPTKATPDQASFAMIVIGVVASFFFLSGHLFLFFIGVLLLQLWYVVDCVDGELARYRIFQKKGEVVANKTDMKMTGAYWDYLNHYIIHGLVPLTISYGVFRATNNSSWLLIGFVASIFQTLLLAIHDTKSRAFLAKITKGIETHSLRLCGKEKNEDGAQIKKKINPLRVLFIAVHYSCTYPTVMNIATLCAIFSLFTGFTYDFRKLFLVYCALSSAGVFVALAYKLLNDFGLDKSFDDEFKFEEREGRPE